MSIQTYRPGPTGPAAPEPAPYQVPRSSPVLAAHRPAVWRVQEADLGVTADWLIPRLQQTHPRLSPEGLFSWLRATILDRTALFIRTELIAGLFVSEPNVLDVVHTSVIEKFVRSREVSNEEAILLYRFARDWAVSIRAGRMIVNRDSDCAMVNHVCPALSDVKKDFIVKKSSIYTVQLTE